MGLFHREYIGTSIIDRLSEEMEGILRSPRDGLSTHHASIKN